jgi:hypothetical protein
MLHFDLTGKEVARVRAAAEYAGFPWQPICTRPKTARQFCTRIEAEMRRQGDLISAPRKPRLSRLRGALPGFSLAAGKSGGLMENFGIKGLPGCCDP